MHCTTFQNSANKNIVSEVSGLPVLFNTTFQPSWRPPVPLLALEQVDVGLLGHPDLPHGLHRGLPLLLELQQLVPARQVAAVQLGKAKVLRIYTSKLQD